MKKAWQILGRLMFWVTWPALYLYLRFSIRTRVFIFCGDEILAVKGWLSSGGWAFPGGGLHRGEDAAAGAAREVLEETGIRLEPSELVYYFDKTTISRERLKYRCIAFGIELPNKPKIKTQKLELIDVSWQPIKELITEPHAGELLIPALSARAGHHPPFHRQGT